MPIRLLSAQPFGVGLTRFTIHIDDTRVLAEPLHLADGAVVAAGQPDPSWVIAVNYLSAPPSGSTPAAYRAQIRRELRALAQEQLAARAAAGDAAGFTPGEVL